MDFNLRILMNLHQTASPQLPGRSPVKSGKSQGLHLSIYLSIHPSINLYIYPSIYLYGYLVDSSRSISLLDIYMDIYLSIADSTCLSPIFSRSPASYLPSRPIQVLRRRRQRCLVALDDLRRPRYDGAILGDMA